MTLGIESHAGNNRQVNLLEISKRLAFGFSDAKRSTREDGCECDEAHLHLAVAHNHWQQHTLALVQCFLY